MKRFLLILTLCMFFVFEVNGQNDLVITGIFDGPLTGGEPKVIELYVINDVPDLSLYSVGSANNGGGSDGPETTLSGSANAGDFIYIIDDNSSSALGVGFNSYFGFTPTLLFDGSGPSGAANINGDDAIELFYDATGAFAGSEMVVDVFGDINATGQTWEYLDGWAYRMENTGPDGSVFVVGDFSYSGVDATDGCTTNATCTPPFPIGSFSFVSPTVPTLSQWGLINLALMFMICGTLYIREMKLEIE